MATKKVGRDAGNGQFIPIKTAKTHPKTTIVQTVKVGKKGK